MSIQFKLIQKEEKFKHGPAPKYNGRAPKYIGRVTKILRRSQFDSLLMFL